MAKPRIVVPLVDNTLDDIARIEPLIDIWEVRLDLIGAGWQNVTKELKKPWIACNRSQFEGGRGQSDEFDRIKELLKGLEAGASIVDIELSSSLLGETVPLIKERAKCLISYHNYVETPDSVVLSDVLHRQQKAGADICKIVTTARNMEDNLTLLRLIRQNAGIQLVAFAMGAEGRLSRVLSPLAGACFTFASIESGKESASGQMTAKEMRGMYDSVSQRSKVKRQK